MDLRAEKLSKPNHKEWCINHLGYKITVTSWFSWNGHVGTELLVDGHLFDKKEIFQVKEENIDEVFEFMNPQTPILKVTNVSEAIQTIEVYSGGAFRRKLSIMIDGKNVFQDKLNGIDRLFQKYAARLISMVS